MKKTLLLTLILLIPPLLKAQTLRGNVSAAFYSYERALNSSESVNYLRNFELFNLTYSQSKFSVKTRFNFQTDLSENFSSDPMVRFYNLYVEGKDLFNLVTLRLGRQSILNSWGGLFDGINLKFNISNKYKLTTYFGGNVPAYQKLELIDNFSDNYILGAKFSGNPLNNLRFNLNFINKNYYREDYYSNRLDADLNPINFLVRQNSTQYTLLSADVTYNETNKYRVYTRADYDLNFMKFAKFQLGGRYQLTEKLGVSSYFNLREPRLSYNSIFSVFNYGNSKEIESGIDYKINKNFSLNGKYAYVTYKSDNSSRLTIGFNSKYGNVSYRKTFGYAGELDALSIYTAKSFLDGKLTPNIGISFTNYKLDENSESNNLTSVLAGVNVRPYKALSVDLQGQYFNNEIYKNDFRILLRINHWFNIQL